MERWCCCCHLSLFSEKIVGIESEFSDLVSEASAPKSSSHGLLPVQLLPASEVKISNCSGYGWLLKWPLLLWAEVSVFAYSSLCLCFPCALKGSLYSMHYQGTQQIPLPRRDQLPIWLSFLDWKGIWCLLQGWREWGWQGFRIFSLSLLIRSWKSEASLLTRGWSNLDSDSSLGLVTVNWGISWMGIHWSPTNWEMRYGISEMWLALTLIVASWR